MNCPGCDYESNDEERCPECGRNYVDSRQLVKALDRFKRVLSWSHALWIIMAVAAPFAPLALGPRFRGLGGFYFLLGSYIAIRVEIKVASMLLYRLDASPRARNIWCACVVASSVIFAGYMWFRLM